MMGHKKISKNSFILLLNEMNADTAVYLHVKTVFKADTFVNSNFKKIESIS